MRLHPIPTLSKQKLLHLLRLGLHELDFEILMEDSSRFSMEGIKEIGPGQDRLIHAEICRSDQVLCVKVHVQTIGLELKRSKQNDYLEIQVIRHFIRLLREKEFNLKAA